MRSPTKHVLGSVIAAVLLGSGVAACGSGSSTSASSTTTAAAPSTVATGPGVGRPPVVLGTKNFTEEFILGQLYAQALRAKGFRVTLRNNLGASEIVERKLASGTVDAYPEYTGTILSTLAHQTSRPASANEAYERAASFERAHGATLLAMAPAQDTDVLATKPAYAARHRLHSLADLTRLGSSVTLAAPPEFRTRFNGLVGLRQVYGLGTVRFVPVKIGTQYRALERVDHWTEGPDCWFRTRAGSNIITPMTRTSNSGNRRPGHRRLERHRRGDRARARASRCDGRPGRPTRAIG